MFGASPLARSLVRGTTNLSNNVQAMMPNRMKTWIDSRFNNDEVILEKGASFDLVRASVNLTLAGILIALATSLKIPLSTTYVTFMIAMSTSLSDRAWGRENAVFRITGVVSVIGGWFITAIVAFSVCFILTLIIYHGGLIAIVCMVTFGLFYLWKSKKIFDKKKGSEKTDEKFNAMMHSRDSAEIWDLLKQHTREHWYGIVQFAADSFTATIDAFIHEDQKAFRKITADLSTQKSTLKKVRRRELIALRRIEVKVAVEKNTWFHIASNNAEQMIYSLRRMADPCKEHIDNNFNQLPEAQANEFLLLSKQLVALMQRVQSSIENSDYRDYPDLYFTCKNFAEQFSKLRLTQIERIRQSDKENLNVAVLYLNLIQESQEFTRILRHLLRASRKFQAELKDKAPKTQPDLFGNL
jgi:uncharacterized membrane protein/phage pi2 protein 07